MTTDIFQGDPRLFLDEQGADIIFIGGQPTMDPGVENLALIALFTQPDWAGNAFFRSEDQQIGSDFLSAANEPITISSMNNVRDAAIKALTNPVFGDIEVTVTNPSGYITQVSIIIGSPGSNVQELLLTKHGLNWQLQSVSPAHERR